MNIALFALTGFGNRVLRALVGAGRAPSLLVTRRETGPYPYHPEEDLAEEAGRLGVATLFGRDGEAAVAARDWDLVLVATYHRMLAAEVLAAAPVALNLHPSLLPRWRGAAPIHAALRHGDAETGVSAVVLGAGVDDGPVVAAARLAITAGDDQGTLRGSGSPTWRPGWRSRSSSGSPPERCRPASAQAADAVTWAHRPSEAELQIDPGDTAAAIARQVRAPAPVAGGADRGPGGRPVAAIRARDAGSPGVLGRVGDTLTLRVADGVMELVVR